MLHNALNHSASACSTWGCTLSMKYVNNFSTAPVVDTRFSEPFDLFCLQVVPKKQQQKTLPTLEQGGSVSVALVMVLFFPFTRTGSAHFSTNTFSSNVSYPYANHFADRACEFLSVGECNPFDMAVKYL